MAKPVLLLSQIIDNSVFRAPRVVAFNRLEARPRTLDFTRSLRAEVRDPLWMLTRQWQFGEFGGEDAASCVSSRIAFQHEAMDRVAFRGAQAFPFDPQTIPLETKVEREQIPLTVRESGADVFSDVLFAVQLGKKFLRMLQDALPPPDQHYDLYLEKFPLRVLPEEVPLKLRTVQDADAEQIQKSVAGRIADGVAIWRAVENGAHDTWVDSEFTSDPGLKPIAATFAAACSRKFQRLFTQPDDAGDSAWLQNHLEYQFSVAGQRSASQAQTVLLAGEYQGGHLDWHSFDIVKDRQAAIAEEPAPVPHKEQVESFFPANVRFKGQPQPRFWEMEETETDFGKIETSATGLLHLMLAEFGLVYSNDWFMLPHPMDINTVCEIRGILVDDTFGRHTFIRPAGRGPEAAWQRWAMFHLTEKEQLLPDSNRFYLVPAVSKVLESAPLERVNFIRDEMANMVWGVESIVPSQTGQGMSGYETAPQTKRRKHWWGMMRTQKFGTSWVRPFRRIGFHSSRCMPRAASAKSVCSAPAWLEVTRRAVSCCASRVHRTSSRKKSFRAPEFSSSVPGSVRVGSMAAHLCGSGGGRQPAEAKVGVSWCLTRSWI